VKVSLRQLRDARHDGAQALQRQDLPVTNAWHYPRGMMSVSRFD
jgi:hypothetical protein